MYAPALDPSSCPDCGQWHGGNARCPSCGLPLSGPLAAEMWSIDTSIAALHVRRTEIIAALRQAAAIAPTASAADAWQTPDPVAYPTRGGAPAPSATAPRQRTEWTQQRVQNLLLGLGVLLLAVAAIIFTAVAWRSLGIGAKAAVMAAVTAAAAAAAPIALRRRLPATGEAVSALAVLLLLIDAYALRQSVPAVGETKALLYWAAATALIAALCGVYAALVPLRTPRAAAAAAAMVPLPLLAIWSAEVPTAALLMLGQAGASAFAATVRRLGREAVLVLRAGAIGAGVVGASLAGVHAFPWKPVSREVLPGAALLVFAAAVSVLSGWLRRESTTMVAIAGGRAAAGLVLAVAAVARLSLTEASLPAVAAVSGLCVVAAALLLGRWQRGPLVVGTTVVGLGLVVDGSLAAVAVARPLLWLEDVWGLRDAATLASRAVPGQGSGPGTRAVLVTLVAAAVTAWLVGRRTGRAREGLLAAGALVTLAVAAGPVALSWTYAAAIGWHVALAVSALAAAWWLAASRPHAAGLVALPGAALLAVAVGWSLANEAATLAVVGVGAVALAALALRPVFRLAAGSGSALLALGWVYAIARSSGADIPPSGFALAVAAAAVAGVGWLLRRDERVRVSLEAIGAAAFGVGLVLATADVDWLAGVLAVGVLTAAALALDPARREAAALSGALAVGLTWSTTAALGGSTAQQGLVVAVTGCALAGVGWLLRAHSGELIEAVAGVAYAVGAVSTAVKLDALSVALAVGGVTALAVALRPDRRQLVYLGAALLCGCLWVRLVIAGVSAPEPYVVPPALAALVLGHLRRRADAGVGSWPAYGPGLVLALLPTLYVVLSDQGLTRPLALGAGALAVLLLGVRDRLQAPLVLGGATLAIDALIQIAPYAAELPRWVSIGTAGLLLVAVGATYEQRLRDLRRIQDRFDALA